MKGTLPVILLGAVAASLLVAAPALAGYCEAYCDSAQSCNGDCSVNQDNCSVICIEGGCDVECYTAPKTCGGGGRLYCPFRPPPLSPPSSATRSSTSTAQQPLTRPAPPEPGWALLRYELRLDVPLVSDRVVVVRASSEDFAQFARETEARLENEDLAKLRQDSDQRLATALGGPMEILFVAPRHACDRLRSKLKNRQYPGELPRASETVYFRAATDGTGRIASLDVLYSEATEPEIRRIVAFGEENLQVWSRQDPNLPLQLFGFLRVTPAGKIGYMLEAGNSLF